MLDIMYLYTNPKQLLDTIIINYANLWQTFYVFKLLSNNPSKVPKIAHYFYNHYKVLKIFWKRLLFIHEEPSQSSADCPHQYGMFRSSSSCEGSFLNCVAGKAIPHECPEGLAFNEAKLQCDWPDQVQGCDTASFLRFSCPGLRVI